MDTIIHNIVAESKVPLTVSQIAEFVRKCSSPSRQEVTEDQIVAILSRANDIGPALAFKHLTNSETKIQVNGSLATNIHKIIIEGNMGTGKTTLCSKIENMYPIGYVRVHREVLNADFLSIMYTGGIENAFAFQMYMLTQRYYAYALDQMQKENPPTIRLHDRSLIGDVVFAVVNCENGNISRDQFLVYRSIVLGDLLKEKPSVVHNEKSRMECKVNPALLFQEIAKCPGYLDDPSITIWYLEDTPEECKKRVEQERKIAAENSVPIEYYYQIQRSYDRAICAIENIFPEKVHRFQFPLFNSAIQSLSLSSSSRS